MSRLIIARTSAIVRPAGGVRVKCVEPSDARLLARERDEHDVARQRAAARAASWRADLEQRRRAGGVVVGAEVRQVAVGRQRVATAEAQVIVVRADDDHAAAPCRAGARPRAGARRR